MYWHAEADHDHLHISYRGVLSFVARSWDIKHFELFQVKSYTLATAHAVKF